MLDLPDDASLQQLSADLMSFFERASVRPDVDQRAVGEIRKAAEAAGTPGDEPWTKRYLKAAGKWAIDLANEISSDLVVSALKSAAGLSRLEFVLDAFGSTKFRMILRRKKGPSKGPFKVGKGDYAMSSGLTFRTWDAPLKKLD